MKTSSMRAVSDNTALRTHKFAKSVEPSKVETSYPSALKQEGNALVDGTPEKKTGSRWVFKWRWGSKTTAKGTKMDGKGNPTTLSTKSHLANPIECKSPTAEIMSDACDCFVVKSDRFSSMGSTEKLGTPKHRRVLSWGSCMSPLPLLLNYHSCNYQLAMLPYIEECGTFHRFAVNLTDNNNILVIRITRGC